MNLAWINWYLEKILVAMLPTAIYMESIIKSWI